MTQDIFTSGSVEEVRSERAQRAVKAFRAMQPGLSGYARAITGRRDVTVELAEGIPRTDGKKIFFKPPIALGDLTPHSRSFCERRDSDTMQQMCPACRVREEVLIMIYHEIAHIVFGTFEEPSEAQKRKAVERAIDEAPGKYAQMIRDNWDKVPEFKKKDFLNLSSLISPFLPTLVNVLEDARVDEGMFRARRGTRVMLDAFTRNVFASGVEADNGEYISWAQKPLNSQAVIGVFVLACKYDYKGWFHEDVEAALADTKLRELVARVDTLRSSEGSYNLAFPILARLRELGFCRPPEEEDDEPEETPEPEQEPDQEPEENEDAGDPESDNKESNEDEAEADSAEAGSGDDEEGDPEDDGDGANGGDGEPSEGADGDPQSSGSGDGEPVESTENAAPEDDGTSSKSRADSDQPEAGQEGSDGPGEGDAPPEEASAGSGEPANPDEAPADERDGSGTDAGEPEDEADGGPSDGPGGDGDSDSPSLDDFNFDPDGELTDGEEGSGDGSNQSGDSDGDDGPADGDADGEPESDDRDDGGDDREAGAPGDDPESGVDPSGNDDDVEVIDSGADEGEGGTETERPEYGTADDAMQDVQVFSKHEAEVAPPTMEERDDEAAIDKAIIQGLYFEKPSANVAGVREHKYGVPLIIKGRNLSTGWDNTYGEDDYYERQLKRLGISTDTKIGEDILGPSLLEMRRTFSDNQRASMERHMRSGKINQRVLGKRAWAGDDRLFQKKRLPGRKSYAVLIGIDISGSTVGVNIALAKRAAMAQAELCARAGIDFAVYAHTANGDGINWGSNLWLDVYEIKAFDKPWNDTAKEALNKISSDCENLDGHTIEYYRKMIERHPATDKVILYYSDGKMPAANHDEELEILVREIAYCRSHQITLMGVGIRTDSPRRHGLNTVQVDDDSDIPKVVRHLQSALLHNR